MKRKIIISALLHYGAYIIMSTLCLLAELRRGPRLPDLWHDNVPVFAQFGWINNTFWMSGLLFGIALLIYFKPVKAVNYLRVGAAVSIARGIFIVLTTLGPPDASVKSSTNMMAHLSWMDIDVWMLIRQWLPVDVLWGGSSYSAAWLTQDLFFSGHTSSSFLFVLLFSDKKGRFFYIFLFYHLVSIAGLLLTHEHYTIDILAAYFITFAIHRFMQEKNLLLVDEAQAIEEKESPTKTFFP